MDRNKVSLVLEGGGMRGAYTAGALSWLIDQGISFDNAYGISTGAVHLCNFLMDSKDRLYDYSTRWITDKRIIGIRALLRCGRIVDYDYLFEQIMGKELHFDISPLKDCHTAAYIGLYDLKAGRTDYYPIQDICMDELKASTSLPIIGKVVDCKGKHILDGGITDMIPIEKAIADGCNRHLIITTKPGDYKRKPAKTFVVNLMKLSYPECPQISEDYRIRHLNYQKQIELIRSLQEDHTAAYIYPSKGSNVTRLGGTQEELAELYELGRTDMENAKEEILSLFHA